jgi:hypothetical protein
VRKSHFRHSFRNVTTTSADAATSIPDLLAHARWFRAAGVNVGDEEMLKM